MLRTGEVNPVEGGGWDVSPQSHKRPSAPKAHVEQAASIVLPDEVRRVDTEAGPQPHEHEAGSVEFFQDELPPALTAA